MYRVLKLHRTSVFLQTAVIAIDQKHIEFAQLQFCYQCYPVKLSFCRSVIVFVCVTELVVVN